MKLERHRQPERCDSHFKRALRGSVQQRIGALHDPHRRLQNGTAGIAKALARANQWLLPDDAFAAHFLALAAALGDFPVARHELHAMGALIVDGDGIAEDVTRLRIIGLIGTVARRNVYLDS